MLILFHGLIIAPIEFIVFLPGKRPFPLDVEVTSFSESSTGNFSIAGVGGRTHGEKFLFKMQVRYFCFFH